MNKIGLPTSKVPIEHLIENCVKKPSFRNTVCIVQRSFLVHALNAIRHLGIHIDEGDVLRKGNEVIALYLPNNFSFIAIENFAPKMESFQMLEGKEERPIFFPEHLNHPENYGKEFSSPPNLSKFTCLQDSRELLNLKEEFVRSLKGTWSFDVELKKCLMSEAKSILNVVIQLLEFSNGIQTALKPLSELPHIDIFRFSTLPSYSYAILQKYCLVHKNVFAIPVGQKGVATHSASGWECLMQQFITFNNPDCDFEGAFVSSSGSKKIGQFFVDLYNTSLKIVYHLNGCFYHG